ncbi:hypothetical protein SAMN05880590_102764 [Rhizobium sp. RU35A]|uniref:hypothetical protein n=1 Tax=Rhizobium sp. RU35A TaxID=1907414 RepID=UPI000956DA5F|nr:hypothetical protein [Rhizobium sp. RU35A]SIQ24394.1 hypothetical protein SAMN05880590_102764 [Rhizobium sp. RU35A]
MNTKAISAVLISTLAVIVGIADYQISSHIETKTIHIVNKERLMKISTDRDGNTSSSYTNFVYAEDELYVVQDSLWNGHFRAGSVYASIRIGADCAVTLSGYRYGPLSMYQNIIAASCGPEGGAK